MPLFLFSNFISTGAFSAISTVFNLLNLLLYAASAAALMLYTKRQFISNSYLAFLPVGREYLLGTLAEQYNPQKNSNKWYTIVSAVAYASTLFIVLYSILPKATTYGETEETFQTITNAIGLLILFIIYLVLMTFFLVYTYIVKYRVFKYKAGEQALLWLIASIFLGNIALTAFLLIYMNKPGEQISSYNP